ncbi:MAG: 4Fe-4S binding protein [Bacillota bacterium]|nr:4Fe-4S binding protein [Bacillota bacterium]
MRLYQKETPDFAGKEILFGLNETSSNEEIMAQAIKLLREIRSMPAATVRDGKPEARVIDFCVLSDNKAYFIASKGKPLHRDLLENPYIILCERYQRWYTFRLQAKVKIVSDNQQIWDEFFSYNIGTATMYGKHLRLLDLFQLESGEGELLHLYADDKLKRARFAFGGATVKPFSYRIKENCNGCGLCLDSCCECAIVPQGDRYKISYMDCNDCGKCYVSCPQQAIECSLHNEAWQERMFSK